MTRKEKVLPIRITPKTESQIIELAEQADTTKSAFARSIIEDFLRKRSFKVLTRKQS
jgi:predicted DNA-binding protein